MGSIGPLPSCACGDKCHSAVEIVGASAEEGLVVAEMLPARELQHMWKPSGKVPKPYGRSEGRSSGLGLLPSSSASPRR